jgi:hypothetical protein
VVDEAPRRVLPVRRWLAAVFLGAGLAAVALAPFVDTYRDASGLVRAGRSTQSEWTLSAKSVASLIGPWALRLGAAPDPDGERSSLPGLPHVGLVAGACATWGALRARRRWLARALVLTIAVYLARIYGFVPLSLAGVPVLGSINVVKYCFPLYLAIALLVAFGVDAVRVGGTRASVARFALLVLLVAELLSLAPGPRPRRLDPYAPAPWVDALRSLDATRSGRMTGPVDLAPPLVSNAIGLRDLRSIDVLTPKTTYDFVSRLVGPSQGISWILADPDPLTAATSPGAAIANLRWVLAREELHEDGVARVARTVQSARRLSRLFATLDRYTIHTSSLWAGIRELGADRRFHWTCTTPCQIDFVLLEAPRAFAVGLASPTGGELQARLGLRTAGGEEVVHERAVTVGPDADRWVDLWIEPASGARGPASISFRVDAASEQRVFVGGIGPSPGPEAEAEQDSREAEFRLRAFRELRLRYADSTAHVYENPSALGAAYFATDVIASEDADTCVLDHPGQPVACVADAQSTGVYPGAAVPGEVRVVDDGDQSVVVETTAGQDGVLVFSRAYDQGWHLQIDDQRARVFAVNGAMMAAAVPAGTHRVTLRYAPSSFWMGVVISIVALALWVGLIALSPPNGARQSEAGDAAPDGGLNARRGAARLTTRRHA